MWYWLTTSIIGHSYQLTIKSTVDPVIVVTEENKILYFIISA